MSTSIAKIVVERKRAAPSDILVALDLLFSGLKYAGGTETDHVMRNKAYLVALQGQTLEAVQGAVKRFITGKVEGASTRFAPSSAELAIEAEKVFLQLHHAANPPVPATPMVRHLPDNHFTKRWARGEISVGPGGPKNMEELKKQIAGMRPERDRKKPKGWMI